MNSQQMKWEVSQSDIVDKHPQPKAGSQMWSSSTKDIIMTNMALIMKVLLNMTVMMDTEIINNQYIKL